MRGACIIHFWFLVQYWYGTLCMVPNQYDWYVKWGVFFYGNERVINLRSVGLPASYTAYTGAIFITCHVHERVWGWHPHIPVLLM